jgi:hypothetical protein
LPIFEGKRDGICHDLDGRKNRAGKYGRNFHAFPFNGKSKLPLKCFVVLQFKVYSRMREANVPEVFIANKTIFRARSELSFLLVALIHMKSPESETN